jgi:RimJ/RimL family protein N-acetyltransferase
VNTETKLLQLTHAFEVLGCERVCLKTDARNQRSRSAIARIGATEEGTFRRHMLAHDGTWRDSVYFSVIAPEWPALRERLRRLLDR